jgi:hypothetical protein
MKPNLPEIGKIVRDMQAANKSAPNYNAAAAEIVQQGVIDKNNARLNYVPQLSGRQPSQPAPKQGLL